MFIFNTTFNIEKNIHENWVKWMRNNFLTDAAKLSMIKNCKILKLLTEIESEGMTYSVQFTFDEMEEYVSFELNHKEKLFERHNMLFRGKFVTFSTLLEEI